MNHLPNFWSLQVFFDFASYEFVGHNEALVDRSDSFEDQVKLHWAEHQRVALFECRLQKP